MLSTLEATYVAAKICEDNHNIKKGSEGGEEEEEVRGSEERSVELPTLVLGTRATGAPTFVQNKPPPLS